MAGIASREGCHVFFHPAEVDFPRQSRNQDTRVTRKENTMTENPRKILLVEDDPGDVDLMKEVLEDAKSLVKMNVVEDGVQAMAYLHKEGSYAKARQPDLILLDLNLPKKDGHQVLREIKSDENLKDIPVVVLSDSKADRDIRQSYNGGVNCYITKPVGFEQFSNTIRSITDYWFRVANLPSRPII